MIDVASMEPAAVAGVGGVVVFACRETPGPIAYAELAHRISRLGEGEHGAIGLIVVTRPAARLFVDEDRRGLFEAAAARAGDRLRGVAIVVTGTGFAAALAHSEATSMALRRALPCPVALFGDLEQAGDWLASRVSGSDPDRVIDEAERLFASLPSRVGAREPVLASSRS